MPKSHTLLLDGSINEFRTVCLNIYQQIVVAALKFCALLHEMSKFTVSALGEDNRCDVVSFQLSPLQSSSSSSSSSDAFKAGGGGEGAAVASVADHTTLPTPRQLLRGHCLLWIARAILEGIEFLISIACSRFSTSINRASGGHVDDYVRLSNGSVSAAGGTYPAPSSRPASASSSEGAESKSYFPLTRVQTRLIGYNAFVDVLRKVLPSSQTHEQQQQQQQEKEKEQEQRGQQQQHTSSKKNVANKEDAETSTLRRLIKGLERVQSDDTLLLMARQPSLVCDVVFTTAAARKKRYGDRRRQGLHPRHHSSPSSTSSYSSDGDVDARVGSDECKGVDVLELRDEHALSSSSTSSSTSSGKKRDRSRREEGEAVGDEASSAAGKKHRIDVAHDISTSDTTSSSSLSLSQSSSRQLLSLERTQVSAILPWLRESSHELLTTVGF